MQVYSSQVWYIYLTKWQQDLVDTSTELLKREESQNNKLSNSTSIDKDNIDYSFIIFPMGKAYEGFLKKYFFDLDLISEAVYNSRRFRIGRALNPDVHRRHRDEHWLYDDVSQICGEQIAKQLWLAWLECRNRVFHFFPQEKGKIDVKTAQNKLEVMREAMDAAVSCLQSYS